MIYVVGIGPGAAMGRTAAASAAIERADVLVGYRAYIELLQPEFSQKPMVQTGMRGETERCRAALELSRAGKTVALVCSGDASVYGMASLMLEIASCEDEIEIVPGVTAALSTSALLGAPLGGDYATVSLSDLLTPWDVIERRLHAAGAGDFCVAIYNPASHTRRAHLSAACEILMKYRPSAQMCGWARNIGRAGQETKILTLEALSTQTLDMFTTVIVGNSQTVLKDGRLVTRRGYRL